MRMGDGHRQRIGGVGLQLALEVEHDPDHVLDLHLVRAALAHHRQLHFLGRVFVHRQVAQHHRADRRAARMPELERRIGVARHEHLFDGDLIRPVGVDDFPQSLQQALQALREIAFAQQQQRSVMDMAGLARRVDIDDADAGALGTGIDAEDAGHARSVRSLCDL